MISFLHYLTCLINVLLPSKITTPCISMFLGSHTHTHTQIPNHKSLSHTKHGLLSSHEIQINVLSKIHFSEKLSFRHVLSRRNNIKNINKAKLQEITWFVFTRNLTKLEKPSIKRTALKCMPPDHF